MPALSNRTKSRILSYLDCRLNFLFDVDELKPAVTRRNGVREQQEMMRSEAEETEEEKMRRCRERERGRESRRLGDKTCGFISR